MDFVERLKDFKAKHRGLANSRQAFDAKRTSESDFAADIEALYTHFVGTFQRYCGNCWHDAFMRILTLKNMDKKTQFRLFAGTLLHDPVNRDVKYMLTPRKLADMGDELALRHLAHNPAAADYFEKPLPANLDQMLVDYLKREQTAPEVAKAKTPEQASKKATRRKGTPRTSAKKPVKQVPEQVEAPKEQTAPEVAKAKTPEQVE